MHCKYLKKIIITVCAALPLLTVGITCAVFKYTPKENTYTLTNVASHVYQTKADTQNKDKDSALYSSLFDIPLSDTQEYTIKVKDGKISVFDNRNDVLYNVSADLSDFPEEDVQTLNNGMTLTGRELYEIVLYLES